ncbi:MAG: DUF2721 domain-containing protein [Acidobacteria bacterium]|nr:DUF2721 domain-containing protein [Acidobacteriota bacterium]
MLLPSAHEVLGAMITPAVLISASGTLALSTSNRLSRVVDRVRALGREREGAGAGEEAPHLAFFATQLDSLAVRILMLRTALTALYSAIGLFVGASLATGLVALLSWRYGWIPVALGMLGAGALFHASLLLVREGRLAVKSTLDEMDHLRSVLRPPGKAGD